MTSKVQEFTGKRLPPNAGKGRPKGSPNRTTATAKEMILGALSDLGGQAWLVEQAEADPKAFLSLLARLIPTETSASISADVRQSSGNVEEVRVTIIDPKPRLEGEA